MSKWYFIENEKGDQVGKILISLEAEEMTKTKRNSSNKEIAAENEGDEEYEVYDVNRSNMQHMYAKQRLYNNLEQNYQMH